MKRLLFTTPACPNCPGAKKLLEDMGIGFESVDASKPEGLEQAKKHGVNAVPSLIVVDDEGNKTEEAHGVDEIEKLC